MKGPSFPPRYSLNLKSELLLSGEEIHFQPRQQFVAKDFREFIRFWQTTHVLCSPHYPHRNRKPERFTAPSRSSHPAARPHFVIAHLLISN